jgi:hypothetical protein
MAKYLIATVLAVLTTSAVSDDSQGAYAAPSGGYAAPSGGYAPPSTGYGVSDTYAPAPEYQSTGYDAPGTQYGTVDDAGGDLFDLSKILELLPLFLAVFAAIIVAQLFAPLIGVLFGLKLNLATGLLGPLGLAKVGLINAVLAPFNLALCNLNPLAVAGRSAEGKDMPSGFELNPDVVDSVAKMLYKAVQEYSS